MNSGIGSSRKRFRQVLVTVGVALLVSSGCSTLSERDKEDREYRQAEFEAAFLKYQRWCHSMGRQVVIQAGLGPDRRGIPTPGDYYTCT